MQAGTIMRVQPILAALFVVALASAFMADAGCPAGISCTYSQTGCNINGAAKNVPVNTTVYCCGTSSSSCLTDMGTGNMSVLCGSFSYGYSDSSCNNQLPQNKAANAAPQASMAAWVAAVVALLVMMIAA